MDPNANLDEQLGLARQLIEDSNDFGGEMTKEDGMRLAELVLALDEWIANGGFLPGRWSKTGRARGFFMRPPDQPLHVPRQS